MKDGFIAEAAQTCVTMNNLNLFSDDDVPEHRRKGEDSWKRGLSVYHQKRYMVDLEAIGQIVYACSTFVCMCDNHDFMTSIYQLGRELIDVTFDTSWLREEIVTDHGNVVRHVGDSPGTKSYRSER